MERILGIEKNKHLTTCPIFQSTLTLPIIDFSSIDTNISGPFPTAKLHEAVNLKTNLDYHLESAVFNYCQATTFGTDYAMTHIDDTILQTFAPTLTRF
ncbi:178_t:CDS:2 [Entrophospora sp. SA101]|nr:178_t:CDS:2 [Entrophospora sp. SA101]